MNNSIQTSSANSYPIKRMRCFAFSLLVLSAARIDVSHHAAAQDADAWFSQEVIDAAKGILGSGLEKYLSGSGRNALERQSGRLPSTKNGTSGGSVVSLPFQSARFQVMVNDPADDDFAIDDISTHSETAVAAYGNSVVVAFNNSPGFVYPSQSGMAYGHSSDGGVSFAPRESLPVPKSGYNEGDPAVVVNRRGIFYAANIALDSKRPSAFQNTVGISKSTDGGITFGLPAYLPAVGVASNSFQDKEFIAVDTSGGGSDGNLYVTFTSFDFNDFSQVPIMLSSSTNGGTNFLRPIRLSATNTINQGSEAAVGLNGEVYVTWFQFFGPQDSGIVVARSTNAGRSFNAPVFAAPAVPIGFNSGNLLGNFRVNSFPRIDVDPSSGNVYITYASRPGHGDSGDMFFIRSTDGGATWSVPLRVNDDAGNNDQFFPDVAVNSDGIIRLIWYDKRRDPNNIGMTVFTAVSTDGGISFGPNIAITPGTFAPAVGYDPILNPVYMGDYIDIKAGMGANGRTSEFYLAWTDCRRWLTTSGGTRPNQDVFFSRFVQSRSPQAPTSE